MNTNNGNNKPTYSKPSIVKIKLDNEISLALESAVAPPSDPGAVAKTPDYFNNDPFHNIG